MREARKYFGGYCPVPHEKSVVLGGGLVLYPITDPGDVAATLHVYTQRVWELAYEAGKRDNQNAIREALNLPETT